MGELADGLMDGWVDWWMGGRADKGWVDGW